MPQNEPRRSPPKSSCADRRRAERFPSGQAAFCHPNSHPDTTPVQVKDVSTSGVGLVAVRRFERGTILVLQLAEISLQKILLLARVVHSIELPGGLWHTGCVFLSEVSEEEFAAFRGKGTHSAGNSSHAEVILPERRIALCRPVGVGMLGRWTAEIREMSPDAIGLILSVPVEPGVQLHLEISPEGEEPTRTELVCGQRRELRPDGKWLLDCQVIPSPPGGSGGIHPALTRSK